MEAPRGTHLPGQAPGIAILVVDGDEEKRAATVLALESLGHTIVEARSGEGQGDPGSSARRGIPVKARSRA